MINIFIKISLVLFIILAGWVPVFADSKTDNSFMNITYEKPLNAHNEVIRKELKTEAVGELVADTLQELFIPALPSKPLNLAYGGEDGPLYDNLENTIYIPYGFIQEIKERFINANYPDSGISLKDAVMDVVIHTILHEVAHALINSYDLPVVTKEEDAADSLATLLIIEYLEDGEEIALTAADFFDLESDNVEDLEEEDFWDEHSLDVQRYYSTVCYIYGSNPEDYSHLKQDAHFSDERAELCIDEYDQLYFSWMALLKPIIRSSK
jgi:hypothetical protein